MTRLCLTLVALTILTLTGCDRFNAAPAIIGPAATTPTAPSVVRQYYGPWKQTEQGNFVRNYYYKPNLAYAGFKHHLVLFRPDKPDYYFFYNPYTKKFWGRCSSVCDGRPLYSMLPEPERKPVLDEIEETAFPAPTTLPPIPESTDLAKIDLPPDDLESASGGEF